MVQIFLTIKSPNEQAITKQACRDESSLCFFSPYRNIYHALLLCIEHYKAEKSVDRPLYQLKALNSWCILANSPHQMIRNND